MKCLWFDLKTDWKARQFNAKIILTLIWRNSCKSDFGQFDEKFQATTFKMKSRATNLLILSIKFLQFTRMTEIFVDLILTFEFRCSVVAAKICKQTGNDVIIITNKITQPWKITINLICSSEMLFIQNFYCDG